MPVTFTFETGPDGVRRRVWLADGREILREAWDTPVVALTADKTQAAADGVEAITVSLAAEPPDDAAAFTATVLVDGDPHPIVLAAGAGQLELVSNVPATVNVAVGFPRGNTVSVEFV